MGPLYDFDEGGWTRTIDLRTLHTIGRGADGAWMVCWGKYEADVPPDVGAAILAAWRAYHGTHTPAEPVGVPVPQLPDGWAWDNAEHATRALYSANHACYAEVYWSGLVATFNAPIAVVEAVIAAHRARGVR